MAAKETKPNPKDKNPYCHLEPGSIECLSVTWAHGSPNLCWDCKWWNDLCSKVVEKK